MRLKFLGNPEFWVLLFMVGALIGATYSLLTEPSQDVPVDIFSTD